MWVIEQHEKLSDHKIHEFFDALLAYANLGETIVYIDSQIIAKFMQTDASHSTRKRYQSIMMKKCANDTTEYILIPLCHENHWSLLVYRVAKRHWKHYDSMEPIHWNYARKVACAIMCVINNQHRLMFNMKQLSIQQTDEDSCGRWVALNALLLLEHSLSLIHRQSLLNQISISWKIN